MKNEKYWKRFLKKESIQTKLLERRNVIRASYDAMMVRDQPERSIGFWTTLSLPDETGRRYPNISENGQWRERTSCRWRFKDRHSKFSVYQCTWELIGLWVDDLRSHWTRSGRFYYRECIIRWVRSSYRRWTESDREIRNRQSSKFVNLPRYTND